MEESYTLYTNTTIKMNEINTPTIRGEPPKSSFQTKQNGILKSLEKLFFSFNEADIDYAIWRPRVESFENFPQQLTEGIGDIDILFSEEQRVHVYCTLWNHNYVADLTSPNTFDRDIVMFRGYAPEKMKHVMVHAHFKCRFGSKDKKEFQLPHEKAFLASAVSVSGIRCMSIGHFHAARFAETILKEKREDPDIKSFAVNYPELSKSDKQQFEEILSTLIPVPVSVVMSEVAVNGSAVLKQYHKTAFQGVVVHQNVKRGKERMWPKVRRSLLRVSRNKIIPVEIVLLGHNISHKTTVSTALSDALKKVGTCRRIYKGCNRWLFPNRFMRRLPFFNVVWSVTSSVETMMHYALGHLYCRAGAFVVYDRGFIDTMLNYKDRGDIGSNATCFVGKTFAAQQGQLKYMIITDTQVTANRKSKHSVKHLDSLKKSYLSVTGLDYTILDITTQSSEIVVSHIVSDIFHMAAEKQRHQLGGIL